MRRAPATLVLSLAWGAAHAAGFGSPGTAGADFLKIPLSARAAGMAQALAAQGGAAEGLELNPALLGRLDGAQLAGGSVSYFEGITLNHGTLSYGQGRWGAGLSLVTLTTPDIASYDSLGNASGSFRQSDMGLGLGAAYAWRKWSLGLAGRVVTRQLAGLGSSGFEGDAGVAWLEEGWRFGVSAQHLGSLSALEQQADDSPMTFRAAVGWQGEGDEGLSLTLELDGVLERDAQTQTRAGVELGYRQSVFARLGWQYSASFDGRQGLAAGLGAAYKTLSLDYAYVPYAGLGSTHRFSLSARFGATGKGYGAVEILGPPRDVEARVEGNALLLTWSAPEGRAPAGYQVYVRRKRDDALKPALRKPTQSTQLRLKNLGSIKEAGFVVVSVDAKGEENGRADELYFKFK